MKPFQLDDPSLFITYGDETHIKVMQLCGYDSLPIQEDDWEVVATIGIGYPHEYQAIKICDRVIRGKQLKNLASDLLQSRVLLVNGECCYFKYEIAPSLSSSTSSTSRPSFCNLFFRIYDQFWWSAYQVTPYSYMNWNPQEIEKERVIKAIGGANYEVKSKDVRSNDGPSNMGKYDNQAGAATDIKMKDSSEKKLQELLDRMDDNFKMKENYEKKLQELLNRMDDNKAKGEKKLQELLDRMDDSKFNYEKKQQELLDQINDNKSKENYEKKLHELLARMDGSKVKENYEKKLQDLLHQMDVLQSKLDTVLDSAKEDSNLFTKSISQPHTMVAPPPAPPPPPRPTGRYSFRTEEYENILRYCRPSKPDQFIFEIQSFTNLKQSIKDAECHEFESPEFDVGGHKWTLSIYLNGIPSEQSTGEQTGEYISLYLKKQRDQSSRIEDLKLLVRFFIYSYKYKEYLTIQELPIKEFDDQLNREAGISQALKITDFENINNGFVYGGKCRFGIELFNMQSHPQTFTLTQVKKLYRGRGICKFNDFSILSENSPSFFSKDEFKIEITSVKNRTVNYTWKVQIYPTGTDEDENTNASVFLELANTDKVSNGRHVFIDFELRLKCYDNSTKYYTQRRVAWFTQSDYTHGFDEFIPVHELKNGGKYNKDDSITIEVFFNKMFRMEDL